MPHVWSTEAKKEVLERVGKSYVRKSPRFQRGGGAREAAISRTDPF